MTLMISLPADLEARLLERAQSAGKSPADFVSQIVERAMTTPTVDDALAPFRKQVADSGMADEELDTFFDHLRDEAHEARQKK